MTHIGGTISASEWVQIVQSNHGVGEYHPRNGVSRQMKIESVRSKVEVASADGRLVRLPGTWAMGTPGVFISTTPENIEAMREKVAQTMLSQEYFTNQGTPEELWEDVSADEREYHLEDASGILTALGITEE